MRNRGLPRALCVMLCAGLFAFAVPCSSAQSISKVEFDEAVKRAIDRNPTVAIAATNIVRAEQVLQQIRSSTLPSISATATSSTLDGTRGFEGTTTQPQHQLTVGGNVSMPILAPALWASVTQQRDQIEIANLSVNEVRQQIGIATAQAYLQVIAFKRQVEVNQRALDSANAHLDYSTKRLEGGAGSRLNQLRAAQVASSDAARLENALHAVRRAQEALGVLLVENGPVDAGGEPLLEAPASLDEAAWTTARPDLITQAAVTRAAERTVKDTTKEWFPNGGFSFDPAYVAPASLFSPSGSWRLSFVISQPIFEGGRIRANRALRTVAVEQSKLSFTQIQIQARSDVRLADESVKSFERALAFARTAAQQANEVVRISTSAFEVGATTNLEVIDAQREARDADTLVTLAEDAVRRAKLDLLIAVGRFPR